MILNLGEVIVGWFIYYLMYFEYLMDYEFKVGVLVIEVFNI